MNQTLQTIMQALTQHIPSDAAWLPLAGAAAAMLAGLFLMSKGAKLAPFMVALVFIGGGGLGGSFLANVLSTPAWPTIATSAVVGLIAGLALFRLWLSGMVAVCFVAAALSFYGFQVLAPHLDKYVAEGGRPFDGTVTLPAPGELVSRAQTTPSQEVHQLWDYLSTNVPNFQPSFYAIVASAGLAGVIFGLFASRMARSLAAATAGVALFVGGGCGLLHIFAPGVLAWLDSVSPWSWGGVAALWISSMINNVRDCKPAKAVAAPVEGKPATA